ncbi:MAG: isochorismate synthase [Cyclonatronaceae bacterium]
MSRTEFLTNARNGKKTQLPYQLPDTVGFEEKAAAALAKARKDGRNTILSISIPYSNVDPLAVLEMLGKQGQLQYYWEHPEDKTAIAAGETLHQLSTSGPNRFENMSALIENEKQYIYECSGIRHSLAGVHFLGGFSFSDDDCNPDWQAFGGSTFVVPRWTFVRDGELCMLTINAEANKNESVESLRKLLKKRIQRVSEILVDSTSEALERSRRRSGATARIVEEPESLQRWVQNIEAAKSLILSGELKKIVLSRRIRLDMKGEQQPTRVLNQLRHEYPSCYTFMMRPKGSTAFVGSTPERLLSIRSNYILTEGLAGSISRGKSATEDSILEKNLLASKKDLEEHRLVVDAIKKRLLQFSTQVKHAARPGVKKITNVQHLYTPISAWMEHDYNPFTILKSLHPTPAVGGVPVERAISHIPKLELYERGWYAAPFGWLNSKGRGEFVVAIRSGLIKDEEALFYAGCGIVQDSDPKAEWEETKLKLIPMLSAINHA